MEVKMQRKQIDLYLGGDLGLWVLGQVPEGNIAQVITLDESVVEAAQTRGINVVEGDANSVCFTPSKVGFLVHYTKILKPKIISRYEMLYNLHPGYLPWGRGYYPIFWALWEQTPAGATLHQVTEEVDKGPIVAQIRVEYSNYETGWEVFKRVREAEKALFVECFEKIVNGESIPSFPQSGGGTYHSKKEFFQLKKLSDWKSLSGNDLIRLARYLTFPGYTGLEIEIEKEIYEVCVEPTKLPKAPV